MRTSSAKPPARRRPATGDAYLERVNLAIDHIVAHLDQPVRLHLLARAAVLSPFHFHRVFQALTGETPADFSKRLRLDRALILMARRPRPTLTSVALACGFASSSDFSRSFRQRFGVAPRKFDLAGWMTNKREILERLVRGDARLTQLPPASADFSVRLRDIPERQVAYIRVDNPYGGGVAEAAARLLDWAQQNGAADNQWLGYQYDNPEITPLEKCRYYVAVEAHAFRPRGEIGRARFPATRVAEVPVRGGLDLELRVLQWLYGVWLPRSRYVPDDQPAFEAWVGRPFAHGMTHFELNAQLPVRRLV